MLIPDAEGDSITISSDDELMEAVADSVSKSNVQLVRINVTEGNSHSQPGPSSPSGPQGMLLPNCFNDIRGCFCHGSIILYLKLP